MVTDEREEVRRQRLRLKLAKLRAKHARTLAKLGKLEHRGSGRGKEGSDE